ncbi:GntR family transcriptional regulator [Oribacterium sp. WCC10]|uniref:GntR family transcriptional regulator n=1 Tax=Oribacterium sp. WCC10 TaxID=1855343 RepID=UPI0008E1537D|nr:GntR family transcriptional regulator [Oribacterium sp. WCC10]SFG09188.1 DNA-binding transcriptional regulator, GntR family [Oribacterium sp. WCC10]
MSKYSSEEIYRILENDLVTLRIKPEEILSENALSARFDVSRTIIRSALQRLAQAGFLDIIPHVGTKVTSIDLEEVNQFIYMRIAIEVKVIRDFIKTITPPQIEKLRFYQQAFERSVKAAGDLSQKNPEEMNELLSKDLEFHKVYFEYMHKEILWDVISQPKPGYSRFIRLDLMGGNNIPDVLQEHSELMDAIERSDSDAIEGIVSRHLYGGIRRLGSRIYSDELNRYIKS